ncbi:MAG: MotA/TolQ/ExbB proton channel family protein [Oscillospiraceae bacterium]
MDIIGIVGTLLGVVLIVFGIVFNIGPPMSVNFLNMINFIDYPSIAVTVGGTIASLMIGFTGSSFKKIPKHLKIVINPPKYDPTSYIDQLAEFSKEARVNGLLALEDKIHDIDDEFLKNGLMLVVDSVEPEKVKMLMEMELDFLDERHAADRVFYEKGAALAPAFGMIGTLIGLVNMLKTLGGGGGTEQIGAGMAVALLTTFYGSLLANMLFVPVANKLEIRHNDEMLCKNIICTGVYAIQAGENPRFVREKLTLMLPQKSRGDSGDDEGESSGKKSKKPKKEKKEKKK